jgi:hypothetical protein
MKTYRVTYSGNASRFKNFEEIISASSGRAAVEAVYAENLDSNYFPQEDGSIKDSDGHVIASSTAENIEYDGGFFTANEII